MTDYFTQFSCMFDVGLADYAARAEVIRRRQADDLNSPKAAILVSKWRSTP